MEKVLFIVGPTGVGKSKVSIQIAKQYQGEIISGDAFQCYRELTIGSAKIQPVEMEGIPHYLIDCLSYKEAYNVKMFQAQARALIQDIHSRGKLPIVCGGTGLYMKALLYDYVFHGEQYDVAYERSLDALDNQALFEQLKLVDEAATKTLHPNNRKRVIRALMMAHLGHQKSQVLERQQHEVLYDGWIVGLTMEREHLYANINNRVIQMIEAGLEQEVMQLVTSPDDFNLQSLQGIGYKEWLGYYRKQCSLAETIARIQKNTRNFAKRQYTWFRNQMNVHWYDVEDPTTTPKMMEDIALWLNQ